METLIIESQKGKKVLESIFRVTGFWVWKKKEEEEVERKKRGKKVLVATLAGSKMQLIFNFGFCTLFGKKTQLFSSALKKTLWKVLIKLMLGLPSCGCCWYIVLLESTYYTTHSFAAAYYTTNDGLYKKRCLMLPRVAHLQVFKWPLARFRKWDILNKKNSPLLFKVFYWQKTYKWKHYFVQQNQIDWSHKVVDINVVEIKPFFSNEKKGGKKRGKL